MKTCFLIPNKPIPCKMDENGDLIFWLCGECNQMHETENQAYKCCKIIEWPLDFDITTEEEDV